MIKIEKEILKTSTQTYRIGNVNLINTRDRGWIAEIMFEILDDNLQVVGTTIISKTGDDYNIFWNRFNSGEYLFQLLIEQEKLDAKVSSEVENEFVNKS